MKLIVRLFVATLAITGAATTLHTTSASAQKISPKVSACPQPNCAPGHGCSLNDL